MAKFSGERFEPARPVNLNFQRAGEPLGHNSSSVNFTIKKYKKKASVKKKNSMYTREAAGEIANEQLIRVLSYRNEQQLSDPF